MGKTEKIECSNKELVLILDALETAINETEQEINTYSYKTDRVKVLKMILKDYKKVYKKLYKKVYKD
jgi:hypothetical protein